MTSPQDHELENTPMSINRNITLTLAIGVLVTLSACSDDLVTPPALTQAPPWGIGDDNNSPADPAVPADPADPVDPTTVGTPHEDQPIPLNEDDLVKVYRYADYACAINKDQEATCWGPAIDDGRVIIPTDLKNVRELALGRDFICTIEGSGVLCYTGSATPTYIPGFMSRMTYRNISTDDNFVCAQGDYVSPFDLLHCGDVRYGAEFGSMVQNMIGEPFSDVTIAENAMGRGAKVCGLRKDGAVYCSGRDRELKKVGPYKQVMHHGSESGGKACAIRTSGEVECWRAEDGLASPAPAGRFSQLYSTFCGFNEDAQEVQCWEALRFSSIIQPPPDPVPTTTLYKGRPRSFAIELARNTPYWCAISPQGSLACTDFHLAER